MLWKVRMVWPVFSMYRWHSPYTAGRAAATSHADWDGNYNSDCQTYIATTHTVNTLGHTTMCSGEIFLVWIFSRAWRPCVVRCRAAGCLQLRKLVLDWSSNH